MDSQPSIERLDYNPEDMNILQWVNLLLPSEEFSTFVCHFPGTNAYKERWEHGDFFISFTLYQNGKEFGKIHSNCVNETGCIELNFDDLIGFNPDPMTGLILAEFTHHKKIFPELYFAHVHR